ncbi:MAG: putative DNA binding domain-containing protein [Kiritimatiellae bacterium]|nr:putative DNA binding domain-containing protein [Kiritimatiellia bacterium]
MTPEEIQKGETDRLEFKREVPKKDNRYLKTVVAFANGAGGSLVFGIDDGTLEVVGVPDDGIRQLEDGLASAISAACTPPIVPAFSRETVDGKTILVVDIYPGRSTPYHIKAEGLGGVYVRVGATTRKAEREQVEELILRGGNRTYDAVVRENETVPESTLKALARRIEAARLDNAGEKTKVTPLMMEGWGLAKKQGGKWHPSVALGWLTANGDHFARIHCALFADDECTEFLDRQELSGSLIDQVEEAHRFVLRSIRRGASIEGLYRKDVYELPPEALREAIVNAVAHRDYRLHACIQVSVSPGRVEILSPGALFDGLTKEEMLEGKSRLRNPLVADVFHKMAIIEKWGTGIRRMFALCRKSGVSAPIVIPGASTVSVRFLRSGETSGGKAENGGRLQSKGANNEKSQAENKGKSNGKSKGKGKGKSNGKSKGNTPGRILAVLSSNPQATVNDLIEATGLSLSGVEKNIRELKRANRLKRHGPARGGHWEVVEKTIGTGGMV